mgnify:CR=1 FL=1
MNTFSKLSAAILLAATSAAAVAAPETYQVDGTHTFPRFSYNHHGLSIQTSQFNITTGTVTLDKEAGTGAVDITIDTRAIDTGSAVFNEHIQAEDFLDTAKYPTATFKSTRVVFEGDQPRAIEGDLTIKGITKPVTLQVTHFATMPHPMLKKDAIGANASTLIKRSEFNAGKYAPYVGDEVTITVAIEAVKE